MFASEQLYQRSGREVLYVMALVQSVECERYTDAASGTGQGVQHARFVDRHHTDHTAWPAELDQAAGERPDVGDMLDDGQRDDDVEGAVDPGGYRIPFRNRIPSATGGSVSSIPVSVNPEWVPRR